MYKTKKMFVLKKMYKKRAAQKKNLGFEKRCAKKNFCFGKDTRSKKICGLKKNCGVWERHMKKQLRNKKMCIEKDMQLGYRSVWHTDMQIEEEIQPMTSAVYRSNRTEEEKQLIDDAAKRIGVVIRRTEAAKAGVTSVCVGPGSANVIGGTFCAIKTYGKRVDDMLVKDIPSRSVEKYK